MSLPSWPGFSACDLCMFQIGLSQTLVTQSLLEVWVWFVLILMILSLSYDFFSPLAHGLPGGAANLHFKCSF